MDGGKPTVSEYMTDTLTSSDYSSAHTSNFDEIQYILCYIATLEHLKSFQAIKLRAYCCLLVCFA